jgi:hypothetical protein
MSVKTERETDASSDRNAGLVDLVPRPDPTVLTTAALAMAVSSLREYFQASHDGMKELFLARFTSMDKAIALLQTITDRQPAEVDSKITNLRTLHEEKFDSIQTQFRERDVRTETQQRDGKVAVDAALQAAKEAVGEQNKSSSLAIAKSEAATSKQIDQLGVLISTTTAGTNDKIEDIKERLTRIEGQATGVGENRQGTKQSLAIYVAVAAIIIAAIFNVLFLTSHSVLK